MSSRGDSTHFFVGPGESPDHTHFVTEKKGFSRLMVDVPRRGKSKQVRKKKRGDDRTSYHR